MSLNKILIKNQNEWSVVIDKLDNEVKKLQSYDKTIIKYLNKIYDNKILDYGAGPGVFAKYLKSKGAIIHTYDINMDMNIKAAQKIGKENVFFTPEKIPNDYYDIILCNLVVCIIDEKDLVKLLNTINLKLNKTGKVFIGFCNPKIFNIPESQLDYRFPTRFSYDENHCYKKIKKEGFYEIIERHRPIEWYKDIFIKNNFKISNVLYTPKYHFNSRLINDFIIFELTK